MTLALEINHADPLPLHVKVERLVRSLADRREYADGGRQLPPEVELASRLGVSRATVRHAMQRLVQEGLLVRKRNAGTRVAPRHLTTSLNNWTSFSSEMLRQGVSMQTLSVKARMAPVPAEVATFFNVDRGRRCLRLIRLKGQDGEPVVEFQSWLHPRLGLGVDENFELPLYELIEREAHVVVARSSEEIGAIAADAVMAAELRCDIGQPILTRRRLVADAGGRPVEFCDCLYRADRFSYGIDIRRSTPDYTVPKQ